MKKLKPFIAGIAFFLVLLGSELSFFYLYYEHSYEALEMCYDHNSGQTLSSNLCSKIKNAADAAYSKATSSHILTYFVIFMVFLILGQKLEKTEERLKDLEARINV